MKTSLRQGRGVSGRQPSLKSGLGKKRSDTTAGQDRQNDIDRIDAALRRLDHGRFGHCLYCGDQISVRRLDRDPAVESCSACNEG